MGFFEGGRGRDKCKISQNSKDQLIKNPQHKGVQFLSGEAQ